MCVVAFLHARFCAVLLLGSQGMCYLAVLTVVRLNCVCARNTATITVLQCVQSKWDMKLLAVFHPLFIYLYTYSSFRDSAATTNTKKGVIVIHEYDNVMDVSEHIFTFFIPSVFVVMVNFFSQQF